MTTVEIFPSMAKVLKDAESKNFKLERYTVDEETVKFLHLRDAINRRNEYGGFKAGEYIRLTRKTPGGWHDQDVIMSDTWMEKQTNLEFAIVARGHVLIAGLGMGMILLAIFNKPDVQSITVVEKEEEIIDMIYPQLQLEGKVKLIHGDIFDVVPPKGMRYDTIFFDIWNDVCGDSLVDIQKLKKKFRPYLAKGGWMHAWRERDFARQARY